MRAVTINCAFLALISCAADDPQTVTALNGVSASRIEADRNVIVVQSPGYDAADGDVLLVMTRVMDVLQWLTRHNKLQADNQFEITAPMLDAYGHKSFDHVLSISFHRDDINKIDWENMTGPMLFGLAHDLSITDEHGRSLVESYCGINSSQAPAFCWKAMLAQ